MKSIRLAVFNTQPPTYLGGVERRILETAKRLHGRVETTVYSGTKGGLYKPTIVNGVAVIPCFSTNKTFPLDNWTFNQTLSRNWHTFKADVYEAHTASGYGLLNALRKRDINAPFVQTIHGVLADEYVQAKIHGGLSIRSKAANFLMWYLAQKESESARKATLIVTISRYSKQKILQYYDVDSKQIRIVPNGVDPDRFKPNGNYLQMRQLRGLRDRQKVLFVGRLIPRKGLSYLVEAAKQVVSQMPKTVFIIVGDGPLMNWLISEVAKADLKPNFVFFGDVAESDLPSIYRCADVFVLPSIQEGQGIALLEAQASAKPVVAFEGSGVGEAVKKDITGFLVKLSKSELADAILRLLSDSSLRDKMGAEGRKLVQKEMSWDVCAQKMLNVYLEVQEMV